MRYCAFLRGINVKGTSMKMVDVVNIFNEAGLNDVSSVLATGNILFSSDKSSLDLKLILEEKLEDKFHFKCFLFIKNKQEVDDILKHNPFQKHANFNIYCCIVEKEKDSMLIDEYLKYTTSQEEEVHLKEGIIYWKVKKGSTLNSVFGKILGLKKFKDLFTSRNMNTIEKISIKL